MIAYPSCNLDGTCASGSESIAGESGALELVEDVTLWAIGCADTSKGHKSSCVSDGYSYVVNRSKAGAVIFFPPSKNQLLLLVRLDIND